MKMRSGRERTSTLLGPIAVILALPVVPAHADSRAGLHDCRSMGTVDFSRIVDAPAQILHAESVATSNNIAGYCELSGYTIPNVKFLIRLPVTWNGKFIERGCPGFCGDVPYIIGPFCDSAVRKGYACLVSDNGHSSTIGDAKWAYNNLQAEIDHAYRGAHVTALAAKAIVAQYYGKLPTHSYFVGSSSGGRQAMQEAQKFPWDFDGIVAGWPSLSAPAIFMSLIWSYRTLLDKRGEPVLHQADLDLLHEAVLAKCDLNDGIRDGLIGDPRACAFDPSSLLCNPHNMGHCLTMQQIDAVRNIYRGPTTSKGETIYMPIALRGSERTWLLGAVGPPTIALAREAFRYSMFQPSPGPTWNVEDFDFDRDFKRLGLASALHDAVNPDLRVFKAAGGKLLAVAGWNDGASTTMAAIDYYETAEKILGRAATQSFFRLFVLPGTGHGPEGDGASCVDLVSALENWVERSQAPDKVIGSHLKKGYDCDELTGGDLSGADFTRPVYPYPVNAVYAGRGDPRSAASFKPQAPAAP